MFDDVAFWPLIVFYGQFEPLDRFSVSVFLHCSTYCAVSSHTYISLCLRKFAVGHKLLAKTFFYCMNDSLVIQGCC